MIMKNSNSRIEGKMSSERLFQNFPNPFTNETKICFLLESPGHALLRVFDMCGRLVQVLVDAHLDAGEHFVVFNASNLPTGIYAGSLQTDKGVEAIWMLHL